MRSSILAAGCLIGLAGSAFAQQPATGVCARLAPQLGLKWQAARDKPAEWRANMLGGLGKQLFGGSTSFAFRLEAPEDADVARQREVQSACPMIKGEVTCTVVGPVKLSVSTRRGDATVAVAAGERARVGTRGTHIVCRDG